MKETLKQDQHDYRRLLADELERRTEKNRSYSKRAFARDLGLSPAYMTQILGGLKRLSPDKASVIASRVEWSYPQKKSFLNLVRLEFAKTEAHRAEIKKELSKGKAQSFTQLSARNFDVIAHWYYSALITLTELDDFQYDHQWIAKRLGLPIETVRSAIRLLLDLKLVREEEGTLIPQFEMLRADSVPSTAIREHHRQYLKRAEHSLETQDFNKRDITGTTIAIDPSRIPEAKKLIKQFREELSALMCDGEKKSEVYRLSVQLFRVDQEASD